MITPKLITLKLITPRPSAQHQNRMLVLGRDWTAIDDYCWAMKYNTPTTAMVIAQKAAIASALLSAGSGSA